MLLGTDMTFPTGTLSKTPSAHWPGGWGAGGKHGLQFCQGVMMGEEAREGLDDDVGEVENEFALSRSALSMPGTVR